MFSKSRLIAGIPWLATGFALGLIIGVLLIKDLKGARERSVSLKQNQLYATKADSTLRYIRQYFDWACKYSGVYGFALKGLRSNVNLGMILYYEDDDSFSGQTLGHLALKKTIAVLDTTSAVRQLQLSASQIFKLISDLPTPPAKYAGVRPRMEKLYEIYKSQLVLLTAPKTVVSSVSELNASTSRNEQEFAALEDEIYVLLGRGTAGERYVAWADSIKREIKQLGLDSLVQK